MWKGIILILLLACVFYPIVNDFTKFSGAYSIHIFSLLDFCFVYVVDSLTSNSLVFLSSTWSHLLTLSVCSLFVLWLAGEHLALHFLQMVLIKVWLEILNPVFGSAYSLIWRRKWQPTPVLLPGESHGRRSLVGYSPQVTKSRTRLSNFTFTFFNQSFVHLDVAYNGFSKPPLLSSSS